MTNSRQREAFVNTSLGIIKHLYSHPSVCCYTVFNEGWGQFDADRVYRLLREADPTRVFDATSGWFKERESDVDSEHVYFRPVKLKSNGGRPLVLSEFGGYSCRVDGHVFNLDKNYGYKLCGDVTELEEELLRLYRDEIVPCIRRGLSGTVLTQLSDVEDETNGLYTYDRQVLKVTPDKMRRMADELFSVFAENQRSCDSN